jgi:tellurite methyltransferase
VCASLRSLALSAVVGFHQDDAGDWVARLECGHAQHVRHKPPLESRPWVTTAEGRQRKLGAEFDCHYCDMPSLPENARVYKRTDEFDGASVPQGLLGEHRTRAGTWGRIVVHEGLLRYQVLEPERHVWILRPGIVGIIAPGMAHRLELCGPTRFRIEFLHATEG